MMRFKVFRSEFFNFQAVEIIALVAGLARVEVSYQMSPPAEEAAAYQTMGFFERMAQLAGGTNCRAEFEKRGWVDDSTTVFCIRWD